MRGGRKIAAQAAAHTGRLFEVSPAEAPAHTIEPADVGDVAAPGNDLELVPPDDMIALSEATVSRRPIHASHERILSSLTSGILPGTSITSVADYFPSTPTSQSDVTAEQSTLSFYTYPQTVAEYKTEFNIHSLKDAEPNPDIPGLRDKPKQLAFAARYNSCESDFVLMAPTGEGKTFTVGQAVASDIDRRKKIIVLVPSLELLDQVKRDYASLYPGGEDMVGEMSGDVRDESRPAVYNDKQIIVATAQTLLSDLKAGVITTDFFADNVLVLDEGDLLIRANEKVLPPRAVEMGLRDSRPEDPETKASEHAYAKLYKEVCTLGEHRPRIIVASATPAEDIEGVRKIMDKIGRNTRFHMFDATEKFKTEMVVSLEHDPRTTSALKILKEARDSIVKKVNYIFEAEVKAITRSLNSPHLTNTDREAFHEKARTIRSCQGDLGRLTSSYGNTERIPGYDAIKTLLRNLGDALPNSSREYVGQADRNCAAQVNGSPLGLVRTLLYGLSEYGYLHHALNGDGHLSTLEYALLNLGKIRFGRFEPEKKGEKRGLYIKRIYGRSNGERDYAGEFCKVLAHGTPYEAMATSSNWLDAYWKTLSETEKSQEGILSRPPNCKTEMEHNNFIKQKIFDAGWRFFTEHHEAGSAKERALTEVMRQFGEQEEPGAMLAFFDNGTQAKMFLERAKYMFADREDVKPVLIAGSGHISRKDRRKHLAHIRSGGKIIILSTSAGERGLHLGTGVVGVNYSPTSEPIRIIQRNGRTDEDALVLNFVNKHSSEQATLVSGCARLQAMSDSFGHLAAAM